MSGNLVQANAIQVPLQDKSVQLCAFSPPYWGLRSYKVDPVVFGGNLECEHEWGSELSSRGKSGWHTFEHKYHSPGSHKTTIGSVMKKPPSQDSNHGQFCQKCGAWRGQLGLEPSIDLFLDHMMLVMAEVWRVLRDDGVCFVNIGDTYNNAPGGYCPGGSFDRPSRKFTKDMRRPLRTKSIKPKSLCLVPQKFAIRCQEAGWIVRSEIIWHKPNPMPESCKDRPTKAHEQVWMLVKNGKYFWDQEAVRERCADTIYTRERYKYACSPGKKHDLCQDTNICNTDFAKFFTKDGKRNIRSVWTLATESTPEAHFATFPSKLVEIMVRAGSKKSDVVIDPFVGVGTTVIVAEKLGRIGIGLDLSAEYLWDIAKEKIDVPMQLELF